MISYSNIFADDNTYGAAPGQSGYVKRVED